MRNVLKLTNRYIVLVTVLILYSLISNVYAVIFAVGRGVNYAGLIFAALLLFLMTAAFFAGWFKMIKIAVTEPEREDANSLIKYFPEGVGEYFLSVLGMMFKIVIIFAILGFIAFLLGKNYIGNPNIDFQKIAHFGSDTAKMREYILGLTPTQIMQLTKWNFLFMAYSLISYFLIFLYSPALVFKSKNPFIAFFKSLQDLFGRKFLKTLAVFALIIFVNCIISVFSVIFGSNAIAGFIITLGGFYVFTASAVGLFWYYYNNFVKSQIGQNVDIKI